MFCVRSAMRKGKHEKYIMSIGNISNLCYCLIKLHSHNKHYDNFYIIRLINPLEPELFF